MYLSARYCDIITANGYKLKTYAVSEGDGFIKWETVDGGRFIYGGTRIENVRIDNKIKNMRLKMVYADHEWQSVSYSGVRYNEITRRGDVIIMAEEYPLTAIELPRFRAARERFVRAYGEPLPDILAELTERGIMLFAHYIKGKEGESIILARRVEISTNGGSYGKNYL